LVARLTREFLKTCQGLCDSRPAVVYDSLLKVSQQVCRDWQCAALTSLCGIAEQVGQALLRSDEQPEVGFVGPLATTWKWSISVFSRICIIRCSSTCFSLPVSSTPCLQCQVGGPSLHHDWRMRSCVM